MKKNLAAKITLLGIVSTVSLASFAPNYASASEDLKVQEETNTFAINSSIEGSDYIDLKSISSQASSTNGSELDKILEADNISNAEMFRYGKQVNAKATSGMTIQWKGAVVKKVVKYMLDHVEIIPSKTLRTAVKKYGSKINSAIETVEAYTWYGLTKAFMKVGIPAKWADAIADFIIKFLL